MKTRDVNDKSKNKMIFREEGWLEHLESENDSNLHEDLELLLRNSPEDRKSLGRLEKTRALVKTSDDVLLPESGHYYMDLHDRIMASIEAEARDKSNLVMRTASRRRIPWGAFAGAASMTMMLALVATLSIKTTSTPDDARTTAAVETANHFDRDLANVAGADTDVSAALNGYESESEYVTAALEEKLKNLSPDQADALLASLEK